MIELGMLLSCDTGYLNYNYKYPVSTLLLAQINLTKLTAGTLIENTIYDGKTTKYKCTCIINLIYRILLNPLISVLKIRHRSGSSLHRVKRDYAPVKRKI